MKILHNDELKLSETLQGKPFLFHTFLNHEDLQVQTLQFINAPESTHQPKHKDLLTTLFPAARQTKEATFKNDDLH